ncbi:MAG TPA: signal peptidase I [Acidobacteriaceae bacterium]|jgi:signal peptidase I
MAETTTTPPTVIADAKPAKESPATPRRDETPLEALASYCAVIVVGLFALTFIFQNFVIPSGSMEKTLLIGDHVLVDRVNLAPPARWAPFVHYRTVHRGDIIVFYKPGEPDMFLVKRVVGIPGDHLHLHEGYVYLNGKRQDEPQAGHPDYSNYDPYRDEFPNVPTSQGQGVTPTWANELPSHIQNGDLVIPPGDYFAMGDNRTDSLDGRYWGFVPRENIVGRPLFVYWSFITPGEDEERTSMGDRMQQFGHVLLHFFDQTRWRRTFHMVR